MLKEIGNLHLQQGKKRPSKYSPSKKNYVNTSSSHNGEIN